MKGALRKFLENWISNNLKNQPYSEKELKKKGELLSVELLEFFEDLF